MKRINICLAFLTVFLLLSPAARAADAAFDLAGSVCSADNLNSLTASDIPGLASSAVPLPKVPFYSQAPLVITVHGLRFDTINWGPLTYEVFSEMTHYWLHNHKKGLPDGRSDSSEEVIKAAYAKYVAQFEPLMETGARLPELTTRAEPDNYLETRLAQAPGCTRLTIVNFAWSRNPADTEETVKRFVPMLIQAYDNNRGASRQVYILSHSWGSVLMHEVLTRVAIQRPDIKVDKFFTLGSPLVPGNFLIKIFNEAQLNTFGINKTLSKPSNVRYWRNVWASHDYFSNDIPAADVNVQADAAVGAPENELAKFLLDSWHVLQAKADFLTLLNLHNWHSCYYRDYDAYLKTIDKHIHLEVFNPEVAAPLASTSIK